MADGVVEGLAMRRALEEERLREETGTGRRRGKTVDIEIDVNIAELEAAMKSGPPPPRRELSRNNFRVLGVDLGG